MFRSIRLKNFKAYKDSGEIPLKPLTIIIGQNNSGKSTILQALLALKQTASGRRSSLVTTGSVVELGGYYDILHSTNRPKELPIEFSLTQDSPQHFRVPWFGADSEEIKELPMSDRFDVAFS